MNQNPPRLEGTLRDGLYIKSIPSCYSPAQLSRYLTRIRFTPKNHAEEHVIETGCFPATIDNLERLMQLHILAIPFENTSIHYEPEHTMEMDPQKLFYRLVDEGKGSYCCGQNSFLLHVLRGLGYRAYNVAGRVNEDRTKSTPRYGTYDHILVLVQPVPNSNITYVVDVGFGTGPVRPILLSDSQGSVVAGVTPAERFRTTREVDLRSSLECRNESNYASHQTWIVQVQRDGDNTVDGSPNRWTTLYSFSEDEWYENDIIASSLCIVQGYAARRFRKEVVVTRFFLLDREGILILDSEKTSDELNNTDVLNRDFGRVTLLGTELKFTYGRKSETRKVRTESERIRVLKDVFGIVINEDGKQCIQAFPSAIGDDG